MEIKKILQRKIDSGNLSEEVRIARLLQFCELCIIDALGEQIAPLVKAQFIKDREICILVSSTVVSHELRFHKQSIIDAMNEKYGEKTVYDIYFRIG